MAVSLDKNTKIAQVGQRHILYDAALIEHPDEALFSSQAPISAKTAEGRGLAVFFEYQGLALVRKHYHRGGMAQRWLGDRYLGFSQEKTRSFREWHLLKQMQALGLSSPVPVAASVIKHGLFYQADLITQEITSSSTLADILLKDKLDQTIWTFVGRCVRQFHDEDVYHADLNARNILIDKMEAVYLIDFDKSYIRYTSNTWKLANLARLNRSLIKFKTAHREFSFDDDDWKDFLRGYNSI